MAGDGRGVAPLGAGATRWDMAGPPSPLGVLPALDLSQPGRSAPRWRGALGVVRVESVDWFDSPGTMTTHALVWFRRDLRLHDNPAWASATASADRVTALYVLDPFLLRGGT